MNLADEAMQLHNALSETYYRLEREQREEHWRGVNHQDRMNRIDLLMRRAADRWRRRMGFEPIYNRAAQ